MTLIETISNMPHFVHVSSPVPLKICHGQTRPIWWKMRQLGDESSRQVYKYGLLPQSSLGQNTAFVTKGNSSQSSENAMLRRTHDKFFYL